MREAFTLRKFKPDSLALIEHSNRIVAQYQYLGLTLTLRQLYYQLVQANTIRNNQRSYDVLGDVVGNARLAGLLDWDSIEDRIRQPWKMPEFDGPEELVQAAINTHRRNRWEGQRHYVELWVEKDALSGVLVPIAQEYHITLMVNRGYSSVSAMYEASKRMLRAHARGQRPGILYIGDHDPSGLDMDRDITDRMVTFGARLDFFERLALTTEQVQEYDPPPNPAKFTDSRAEAYVREHGEVSWEADALPPEELQKLVRKALDRYTDKKAMAAVVKQETEDKRLIREKFGLPPEDEEEDDG